MGKFRIRFTPAYAGKIYAVIIFTLDIQVHPRIRGEDKTSGIKQIAGEGSPPHTRGRLINPVCWLQTLGFTPAYAGKIILGATKRPLRRVHPRIRGEDT